MGVAAWKPSQSCNKRRPFKVDMLTSSFLRPRTQSVVPLPLTGSIRAALENKLYGCSRKRSITIFTVVSESKTLHGHVCYMTEPVMSDLHPCMFTGSRDSSVSTVTKLIRAGDRGIGVRFPAGAEISVSSFVSIPALGPNKTHIHCVPGVKRPQRVPDHQLPSSMRIKTTIGALGSVVG